MKIGEVLEKKGSEVHNIEAAEPLSAAVARFGQSKIRCLIVTQDGRLAGILTIRDALLHLDRNGEAGLSQRVSEAMTADVVSVTPQAEVERVYELFVEKGVHHLPVVDEGRLAGVVTRADVLASRALKAEDLNAHMLDYIVGLER